MRKRICRLFFLACVAVCIASPQRALGSPMEKASFSPSTQTYANLQDGTNILIIQGTIKLPSYHENNEVHAAVTFSDSTGHAIATDNAPALLLENQLTVPLRMDGAALATMSESNMRSLILQGGEHPCGFITINPPDSFSQVTVRLYSNMSSPKGNYLLYAGTRITLNTATTTRYHYENLHLRKTEDNSLTASTMERSLSKETALFNCFKNLHLGRNDIKELTVNKKKNDQPSAPISKHHIVATAPIHNLSIGMNLKQISKIFQGTTSLVQTADDVRLVGNTVLVKQYMVGDSEETPGTIFLYFHEDRLFCIQLRLPETTNRAERKNLVRQLASSYGGTIHEINNEYYDTEYSNSIELLPDETKTNMTFTKGEWLYIRDETTAKIIETQSREIGLEEISIKS